MTRTDSSLLAAIEATSRRTFLKSGAVATAASLLGVASADEADGGGDADRPVEATLFYHDLAGSTFEVAAADLSWTPNCADSDGERSTHAIRYVDAPSYSAHLFAAADAPIEVGDRFAFDGDPTPVAGTNRNLVAVDVAPLDG